MQQINCNKLCTHGFKLQNPARQKIKEDDKKTKEDNKK